MQYHFGGNAVDLSIPRVMGVLNVTPDSFFDGGRLYSDGVDIAAAVDHAESMVHAGASIIDVGGESTRPGATPVTLQEELDRVLPVVEAIKSKLDIVISIDTSTPEVMVEGAAQGAGLINDVRALQRPGALKAAASTGLPVCLMHMQGEPDSMQKRPQYDSVVAEVASFLGEHIRRCQAGGISTNNILVDPGFGFGKTDDHNIDLLKHLGALKVLDCPILVGLSRKSMIGRLLGRDPEDRLAASLALGQVALSNGASILRVHDVQETVDMLSIFKITQ